MEFGHGADGPPTGSGVAVLAGELEIAVGIARFCRLRGKRRTGDEREYDESNALRRWVHCGCALRGQGSVVTRGASRGSLPEDDDLLSLKDLLMRMATSARNFRMSA